MNNLKRADQIALQKMRVHSVIKDLSEHAALYHCPIINDDVVVNTGDIECDACGETLEPEQVYSGGGHQ